MNYRIIHLAYSYKILGSSS